MNTFALATLTLSTLCLGGAFAAIVTARHVRLRRDAEDRRALGHVLEEVDRRLAALAAAEESSATAQIVGRLVRLDERVGLLAGEVAESVERAARAESAAAAPVSAAPTIEELLEDAPAQVEVGTPAEPRPRNTNPRNETRDDSDDPELAALLAKFEDDSFSFADAARSKGKGAARPSAAAAPVRVAASEEHAGEADSVDSATTFAPAEERASRVAAAEDEREGADVSANESFTLEEPLDLAEQVEAGDVIDELLDPEAFADDEQSDDVASEDVIAEELAVDEVTEDVVHVDVVAEERPSATDDELALDDLVLFFHEDDQGEVLEASADDVALFEDVPPPPPAPQPSTAVVHAAPAESVAQVVRPEPRRTTTFRASIDELNSLTERLSRPTQDRSERLRLVNELSAALARLRR